MTADGHRRELRPILPRRPMMQLVDEVLGRLRGPRHRQPAPAKEDRAEQRRRRPAAIALRLHCLGFAIFACFRLVEPVYSHMSEVVFLPTVRAGAALPWLLALAGVWFWRRVAVYALTFMAAGGLFFVALAHAHPLVIWHLLSQLLAFGLPLLLIYRTWDLFY